MNIKRCFVFLLALVLSACSAPKLPQAPLQAEDEFGDGATLSAQTLEGNYYIAIAAPLTGPYRALGQTIVEGVTLAVEDFNRNQDSAHKIGTVILDDGGLVSEGLGRADIAIAQSALGVIGHLNSEISVEASRKYARAHIPQISPASTHPKFTERSDVRGYVFRTIGTDRQLGASAAAYALSSTDFKKIAVLYNDRAYGVSVASEFVRHISSDNSKQLVFYETIPVRTTDHSRTVSRLDELEPDLVFFVGEYNDAGYLVRELKHKVPKAQFLSVEGVHNTKFIEIAGKAAEAAVVISTNIPSDIATRYRMQYETEATGYVGSSYMAATILLEAAKANGYKSGPGLSQKLMATGLFTASGDLRDPRFVRYIVKDSKFQVQL